ncbi:carbohydrate ABC transporter membrane protein 1, CUT1 family [Actinokineospora alba]|uniref:Carbohydrate ABC transporter membrane protein 1, CUT1 family n=1 Tax=Actinokineospora alba TaxID=504798 RepID=A0A1H0QQY0_9PSEU|nr:sugar ABC transporter permease [Actinokineospora alba]TDP70433.1 carbohydrate ABC transporter membrane protein 1 (CUT1 family) [Actinokineospora alba]SDI31706.1 multiple sugar transport system permease protein [Actinokineospora alba]SDP19744.1 carbohydrate ABC transporter membrane protein 1, CUT1 family [Actinokineospora alba]
MSVLASEATARPASVPVRGSGPRGPRLSTRLRAARVPYLFLLPGFAVFVLVMAYPMAQAFRISLHEWNILPGAESTFVGVANYLRALEDPVFWKALVNTGVYMLATVPAQLALGMLVALMLNRAIKGRTWFRALYYLPVVTSWVVVSLLFRYLFVTDAGLVNYVLVDLLHVTDTRIAWLQNRWTAMVAICALGIWKGVGWSMIIFLAALQNVPKELTEAAELDGASPTRRFFSVVLPMLRAAVAFVTIMLVIGGFNAFTSIYLMTGGGPGNDTQVLLTYMYEQAFDFLDFGYGSSIAYLLTLIVFALSVVQFRVFRYSEED